MKTPLLRWWSQQRDEAHNSFSQVKAFMKGWLNVSHLVKLGLTYCEDNHVSIKEHYKNKTKIKRACKATYDFFVIFSQNQLIAKKLLLIKNSGHIKKEMEGSKEQGKYNHFASTTTWINIHTVKFYWMKHSLSPC